MIVFNLGIIITYVKIMLYCFTVSLVLAFLRAEADHCPSSPIVTPAKILVQIANELQQFHKIHHVYLLCQFTQLP